MGNQFRHFGRASERAAQKTGETKKMYENVSHRAALLPTFDLNVY